MKIATLSSTNHSTSRANALHALTGVFVFAVFVFVTIKAIQSSLFHLQSVSVDPLSSHYPINQQQVLELAKISSVHQSLFAIDLKPVEARLLKHPWVKGVVVRKQFPDALQLTVIERTPIALLTESNGRVLYLESDGKTFEDSAMVYPKELPILTGFSAQNVDLLKRLNRFIEEWFSPEKLPGLKLSAISYDERLGLRAMISYPMKNQKQMRTVLELGLNLDEASQIPEAHLKKVLDYLAHQSTPASKIWLGDGKKVVVKISRGT